MNYNHLPKGAPAPVALLAAAVALLVVGAATAATNGHITATAVLVLTTTVVAVTGVLAEPAATAAVAVIAWLTSVGFSGPPYADLHLSGRFPERAAVVLSATAVATMIVGAGMRRLKSYRWRKAREAVVAAATEITESAAAIRATMEGVADENRFATTRGGGLLHAVGRRRQLAGFALCVVLLPAITAALTAARPHLSLADDLLIYLVALLAVTVVGGFWPAVVAAVASSLLLTWYLTPPLHTWSIEEPQNIVALLLFVTVALLVGTVVHLSARRASDAARASAESASLLELARTVLAGGDTPTAVLAHLRNRLGVLAELQERTGDTWATVATSVDGEVASGDAGDRLVVCVNEDTRLVLHGRPEAGGRLVEGFAAQAVAALDRERLRTQAAQAEALAEGNRIRTALLAAVSHDLRTPLASIKASVTSLRQGDVTWSAEDEAALLATIEESADRLDALIGNLLDMSRLHTGSLQPFLRAAAIEEIVPVALRGLDGGERVQLSLPETLPLVATDPGLLERALANLIANALRYSPPDRPPTVEGSAGERHVLVAVVDHGPGVPVEARARIFEPFQRLGDRGSGAGVGLGLAVAKGFVEAMGGSITPLDTPGGGLTMLVTLRVTDVEAPTRAGAKVTP